MKYFLPEIYVRFQSLNDEEADAADAAWERAGEAYRHELDTLWVGLPPAVRSLIDDYYLHDAEIVEMAHQGHTFVMVLRLDPQPKQLMILIYSLTAEPIIDRQALPAEHCCPGTRWMYDEIDAVPDRSAFTHRILMNNGWEIQLTFRDLQIVAAPGLLSEPDTGTPERAAAAQAV